MSDPKDFFKKVLEGSRTVVRSQVDRILEDVVFPWYEATTGDSSPRKMRDFIADRMESSLSKNVWVSKDAEAMGSVAEFRVDEVFPQSLGNGYELQVTISQIGHPQYQTTLTLKEFLESFYARRPVHFSDYDA